MLKLRYHWKLYHAKDRNSAHKIYKGMRDEFLRGNEGYIHEVFNLCCKYGRMDLWQGRCPDKVNPLARIRRIVEEYQLKKDLEVAKKVNCIYTSNMVRDKDKAHKLDERLKEPGRFHSTKYRRVF